MKSHKKIFAVLGTVGMLGASVLSSFSAYAQANIKSLDYIFGHGAIDCFERDPSWTDEEYLIQYGKRVSMDEERAADEYTLRTILKDRISSDFRTFFYSQYWNYVLGHYADANDRIEYYNTFHEEKLDEYLNVYYQNNAKEALEDSWVNNYDIVGNYCSASGEYPIIPTTFDSNGYFGYLKMNGEEVELEDEDIHFFGNGFSYHKDDFADLKVELERIDDTTIKAHYILENLTGETADYGLAFYGDIEVGGNDDAAVSRTEDSFIITQDNGTYYSSTFGAQFKIQLDPIPATTYVGAYYDARNHHWENSNYDAFSAMDDIDTGLAYSWQGTMAAGETKEFSSTYYITLAENIFGTKFYTISGGSAEPAREIEAIDGFSILLPSTSLSNRKGYHYAWNTKSDGTGATYESYDVIKFDQDITNFYEIEVKNRFVSNPVKIWGNIKEDNLVITDALREKYGYLLDESYSDVEIEYAFIEDADSFSEAVESGDMEVEKIKEALGKNYEPVSFLFSEGGYLEYLADTEGTYQSIDFEENDYPLQFRFLMDEDFRKGKASFSIARIKCGATTTTEWTCTEYEKVPTTYNYETGEMIFTYDGKRYEEGEDYYNEYYYVLAYTEIPDVPNTGNVSSVVASTLVGLPAVIAAAYITRRTAKK